ncbi:hypothetical protein NQZ68_018932 [Dissostichus eleginoides]|nr:hypothetical protein NQZ68_018932 [Dissostichus eleginoides]
MTNASWKSEYPVLFETTVNLPRRSTYLESLLSIRKDKQCCRVAPLHDSVEKLNRGFVLWLI